MIQKQHLKQEAEPAREYEHRLFFLFVFFKYALLAEIAGGDAIPNVGISRCF